jgi:membrane-bound lytic murein transglycosylase B
MPRTHPNRNPAGPRRRAGACLAGLVPAALAALTLALGLPPAVRAGPAPSMSEYLEHPEYRDLIATLVKDHGFARDEVVGWFRRAELIPRVAKIFDRPAEAKPYAEYRTLFISPKVQKLGAAYLAEHRAMLKEVEARTGVEATAVAAIMGIETKFGSVKPGYRAFDALNSAFALYPRRRTFFRKELIEYLLLCREERADPLTFHSSYAGALGMPQFMPSSYRAYAVDFDGDGQRDIWASHADVAGSIANYLKVHGWQPGAPLRTEVTLTPAQAERFDGGHKNKFPLARLVADGVTSPVFDRVAADTPVAVVSYADTDGRTRYFVLFNNFLTIMRYNTSVNYALVAAELDDYFRSLS